MRFGIKTAPQHTTWSDMLDVWRAADDIPLFESAWNFDHFYPIFSDSDGPCLEAWTMLAAMAQATQRIRIGCQVTGMIYRHPAVLANMAATVDIVSGGRLDIGVGAGWNQEECDAYGIELPALKERFDRFDEGVEAMLLLLSQETSNFDGRYVQLRNARCEPKPVQQPHPPITIGGNGPTRTLRVVARFAQQWNSTAGIEYWPAIRDTLEKRCAENGRDPSTIDYSVNLRFDASAGTSALADSAAEFIAAGANIGIVSLPLPHTPDVLEPIASASTVGRLKDTPMIEDVIEKWHAHLRGALPGGLDELLDDDVVFYSPIVYTPQRGKAITKMYLMAAGQTLPGETNAETNAAASGGFRYTKTVLAGDTAVLEFETTVEGKYVNGVDIIRANDAGRIVEIRVMIRPLQAINLVHEQMAATLERLKPAD